MKLNDLLECLLFLFKPCWGMAILHPKKKSEERRKEQALHLECTVEKYSPCKAWTVGVDQNIGMHAVSRARMTECLICSVSVSTFPVCSHFFFFPKTSPNFLIGIVLADAVPVWTNRITA